MNGMSSMASFNDIKYPPNVATTGRASTDMDTDRLYEPKPNKKLVRIFTVILYMFSVSLGAILLSLYYILFWKNPHTRNLHLPLHDDLVTVTTPPNPLPYSLAMEPRPLYQNDFAGYEARDSPHTAFPKSGRGVPPMAPAEMRDTLYADLPVSNVLPSGFPDLRRDSSPRSSTRGPPAS